MWLNRESSMYSENSWVFMLLLLEVGNWTFAKILTYQTSRTLLLLAVCLIFHSFTGFQTSRSRCNPGGALGSFRYEVLVKQALSSTYLQNSNSLNLNDVNF